MTYLLLFLFSVCLARAQYMAAGKNIGARWNGYGAIDGVLDRTAQAPMVYRVLIPWLIGRNKSIGKYELWQTILIFASLLSLYLVYGISTLLLTLPFFIMTFWYDYWDWTLEIVGFTLAMTSLPLAAFGVVLFSLSRETAPLAGVVYALHSGDYAGGAILVLGSLAILLVVRVIQGEHELYCDRWMWRVNWELLKGGSAGAWLSVLLCVLGFLGAWGRPEFLVTPVIVAAGWLMAKGNETRVFVALAPYAALLVGRWI